jgi:hypothetical protein
MKTAARSSGRGVRQGPRRRPHPLPNLARLEREDPTVVIQFHSFVVKLLTQRLTSATEEIRALL